MKSSVGLLLLVFLFIPNKNDIVNACKIYEFKCTDGTCINSTLNCNNDVDCPDLSDELNCTFIQPCPEGTYKCKTGECVNNQTECPIVTSIVSLSSTIAVDIQSSFVLPITSIKSISATSHSNPYTLLQSSLSSTVIQLLSISAFISSPISIEPTTTHHSYQTSVIQTTPTYPVKTPPTDDQKPDKGSNKSFVYKVTRMKNKNYKSAKNSEVEL
ncbi:unnamed protein product [Mytilus coruscus]|nr:unnamed protein product [Mytilus coruscus]